jgi:hypothetical protein
MVEVIITFYVDCFVEIDFQWKHKKLYNVKQFPYFGQFWAILKIVPYGLKSAKSRNGDILLNLVTL